MHHLATRRGWPDIDALNPSAEPILAEGSGLRTDAIAPRDAWHFRLPTFKQYDIVITIQRAGR
jgi:hypothetical protein